MLGRYTSRTWPIVVAIVVLSGGIFWASRQASGDDVDARLKALEKSITDLDSKPLKLKGGGVKADSELQADVRRQKEEAAESLSKTLREIDERSRTKAIEGGKGVIIQ